LKFPAGRSGVFSQCRDKDSLDICWLRDESLEESDTLPDPDVLAQEIVVDLEAALEQFREIGRFSMEPTLHRKIKKLTSDKCWYCSREAVYHGSISLHFVLIALKRRTIESRTERERT
jgi:hypothetical protein